MGSTKEKIELPEGLDWDTVHAAVQVVEDWELHADGLAIDLVIRLYELLVRNEKRGVAP